MERKLNGTDISRCFTIVAQCAKEIEGLIEAIQGQFNKAIDAKSFNIPIVPAGEWAKDGRTDESDWVYTDTSISLPVKGKGRGRKSVKGYISIQISLNGDGTHYESETPLVHIYYWDDKTDFEADSYIGFPYTFDGFKVSDERLIFWDADGPTPWDRQWAYSVELIRINCIEDIQLPD